MNNKPVWLKHYDFIIIDIICLLVSFSFAYYIRHNSFLLFQNQVYNETIFVMITSNLAVCFFCESYKNVLKRGFLVEFKKTFVLDILSFLIVVLFMFASKLSANVSRIALFLTYAIYFFISYSSRIIYKNYLNKKTNSYISKGKKSLLVICESYYDIENAIRKISKNNYIGYEVNTVCLIKKSKRKISEINIININEVLRFISSNWVDDILIICDFNLIPSEIITGIKETRIPIHIKMNILENQTISKIGDYDVLSSHSVEYDTSMTLIKRLIDIIGGIVGCLFTLILILIIGPIIYIKSPGKIFYVSNRVGKNGKLFKFYKFRSMVINADDLKSGLQKNNRLKDGMMFKIDNDPRIIPGIGNFIRKTSLDEFPQFLNVLKGDMSLVGTRPPTLDEWNKYSPYYRSRLSIKPGITGLWQVSGRSEITDFNEVVKLDNEYINNWSISLDVKILFRTVIQVFKREGSM